MSLPAKSRWHVKNLDAATLMVVIVCSATLSNAYSIPDLSTTTKEKHSGDLQADDRGRIRHPTESGSRRGIYPLYLPQRVHETANTTSAQLNYTVNRARRASYMEQQLVEQPDTQRSQHIPFAALLTPPYRPVIVLKRPRTGSSWVGHTIMDVLPGRSVTNEVSNQFLPGLNDLLSAPDSVKANDKEWEHKIEATCDAAVDYAVKKLHAGGFTLNPRKGNFNMPFRRPGAAESCWTRLVSRVHAENINPIVVVWYRLNILHRVVSGLFSRHLLANYPSLCRDVFHLESCPESKNMTFALSPSQLVKRVRKDAKNPHWNYKQLRRDALQLADTFYEMTKEEASELDSAGHSRLREDFSSLLLRVCKQPICSKPTIATVTGAEPHVKHRLSNFEEVRTYIEAKAPSLLPMLLAP